MDGGTLNYPQNSTIHEQFEKQVICSPDSIAIVHGDDHISYKTINKRENQLA